MMLKNTGALDAVYDRLDHAKRDTSAPYSVAEACAALPTTIRIGPYDNVLEIWTLSQAAALKMYGQYSSSESRISLSPSHSTTQSVVDTLLHEIMHAIFWVFSISDSDSEERTVAMMATGLLSVHRDNPWLTEWIARCLR